MNLWRSLSLALLWLAVVTTPALAGVTVNSPGNGASVTSPFDLVADAATCSSQSVSSMGFSLDSSTDTTIVHSTSMNAQVTAAAGAHTVHVKAWGEKGASCVTDIKITVEADMPESSSGGIGVSSPANGASVASPFQLSAQAATCSSQSVSAMGYSLDSSSNTSVVDSKSMTVEVTASTGAHTLHVKAWGDKGAACDTNLSITVGKAASGSPPASSSDAVTVDSPANGASVKSPFVLSAKAGTCSSQSVGAMGYSLDSSSNTAVVDSTSVDASVTAATGAHTLHVKAWGNQGAACETNVAITVTGSSTASGSSNGIDVTSPVNGASVNSPFDLSAKASTCSSQPVTAMGYSLDGSANTTTVDSTSINTTVSAASGAHTLHVKAWGDEGASCTMNVAVTVAGASSTNPSLAPSDAISISSIQSLGDWAAIHDTGGPGSSSGSMSMVNSPSRSGHARKFATKFSNAGDERYSVTFGDDTSSTNFLYDAWVYVASPSNDIANLELDVNQVMPNGQTVIFGFQCDGYSGTWGYSENSGTPAKPSPRWLASKAKCNVRDWSTNTWHHIQINYARDSTGHVTYKAVWLDGVEQELNVTVPSAFALGWGPSLSTNFQVDGLGSSGSSTLYLDDLTVYRW